MIPTDTADMIADAVKTERATTLIRAIEFTLGANTINDVQVRLLNELMDVNVDAYRRVKSIILKEV